MRGISDFIKANAFLETEGMYYGTFSDMHMVLKEEGASVSAYLYLDLPPAFRKERRTLEIQLSEKGQRYGAKISENQPNGFLKIELKNDEDTGVNLDRFLAECDLLLRPYGREMGLLCAYCRKEMQDVKPQYKMEEGLIVPVCPDCANLESASMAKKADNRKTLEKRRMTRGVVGAMIGSVISACIWALASFAYGIILSFLAALAGVTLIKFMFEKFSRVPNRLTAAVIMAFALFAMVLGSAAGTAIRTNEYYEDVRETAAREMIYENHAQNAAFLEDVKNGLYDNIGITDVIKDPEFYKELILPAALVVGLSLTVDNLNLKSRKRR